MANEFVEHVRKSGLVEEDQLARCLTKLEEAHGGNLPKENDPISKALIEEDLITEWQAEKLLAGKHKGFMLGKYKLLRMLGKGGMSSVYLAEHTLMKRKVAIKVLPKNRVADSTYLQRFRIEARAAAKLDDPNIVRAYDIDQHGDTHYLVMEYVEGRDLHVLVKDEGPLKYESAADYVAQVARGLDHAHEMGLVHRDIKPANCLLDQNGTVKLLDMGLARLIGDEASLTLENNENVLGTADYLAPEQALNSHQADQRADIYSLGCTLYFLLTGHPPFPDGTISERLLKHQVEKAPSIFNDRPDAPSGLVNICNRMMAKDPDGRFQTAGEVRDQLTEWLRDRGIEVGDSSKRSSGDSVGVGSDVFRRFANSLSSVGKEQGSGVSGPPSGGEAPRRRKEVEEDIGLAPLEEEASEAEEEEKKRGETEPLIPTEAEPVGPRVSLIEETLAREQALAPQMRRRSPEDYDPLHPPDFTPPSYGGMPPWIFAVIGVVVVAFLAMLAFFATQS